MWAYVYTDSWFRCRVDLYAFFLRCFNILCYASGFYMLLFVVRCLWCARARVCVIHWHCSAQLSMFTMEKRYGNKIIIIIKCDSRAYRQSRRSATDDAWERTHTLETLLFWRAKRAVKGRNAKVLPVAFYVVWTVKRFALSLLGCILSRAADVRKLILVLDSWHWEWLRFWTADGERV